MRAKCYYITSAEVVVLVPIKKKKGWGNLIAHVVVMQVRVRVRDLFPILKVLLVWALNINEIG